MAISFPTGLDNLTNPLSTDTQNNPSHSTQHANANDILEALETKVGINSSADASSLDYKVTNKRNALVVETKSSDATAGAVAATDYVYFVTGVTTITLPTAVGNTNRYTIKSISGTTTVACNGVETIDGTATIGIQNEDSVDLVSNNTEWKVI